MADPQVQRFPGRDGLELAYRELGSGRPVVLLHAFTGTGRQWIDHGPAEAIAERGYRVILPDLRGHGDSARPHDPQSYPPDVLADDGFALIDWLGLHDYDLGGYSLGARIVLRMLVRGARPARAVVGGQGLDAVSQSTGRTGGYRRVLAALANGEPLEPGSPEAEQAYWITRAGGDPLALTYVLNTHVATPVAALDDIDSRTLVAVGDQDVSHASGDALAAALPHGRFTRVPGNHYTALGSPEFAAAVVSFLGDAG
jgi:pimeloyl-ACP methyl ester carboxylesterase